MPDGRVFGSVVQFPYKYRFISSRKCLLVPEGILPFRNCNTRSNLLVWASAVRGNVCIHKNTGRHLPALFPLADGRISGR